MRLQNMRDLNDNYYTGRQSPPVEGIGIAPANAEAWQ